MTVSALQNELRNYQAAGVIKLDDDSDNGDDEDAAPPIDADADAADAGS